MWWKAGRRVLCCAPQRCRAKSSLEEIPARKERNYFVNQISLDSERQEMLQNYLMMPEAYRDREGGLRVRAHEMDVRDRKEVITTAMNERVLTRNDYFEIGSLTSVQEMMAAGVHFGHKKGTWNPLMRDYLLGIRYDTHIINLDITMSHLHQALEFLCHCVYRGCRVMFMNCRPHFQYMTQATARECGEYFYTGRFREGLFTDCWNQLGTRRLPDLIIGSSPNLCDMAYLEANHMGIPIISLVDSDSDPRVVTYPIPANDDSHSSLQLFHRVFRNAIQQAKLFYERDYERMNRITPLNVDDTNSKVQRLVDSVERSFDEIERKANVVLSQVQGQSSR